MKLSRALGGIRRVFLDTAPVIYFIEGNTEWLSRVSPIFERIDSGELTAVTSPVTLAECLVMPFQKADIRLVRSFEEVIVLGDIEPE